LRSPSASAKHGACVPVHDPERTYPSDRIVRTPNFLLSLGWFCWSTLGRSRSRLRLMRYKHRLNSCLEQSSATTESIGRHPGALCLPYNLQENPHPSLLRSREGTKRGTPYRDGGRPGHGWDGHSNDHQSKEDKEQQDKQSSI